MGELATAATPTRNNRPLRLADFETLWEALDYAAQGCTGYNFFDGQCRLQAALPYAELRRQALRIGRRLRSLGLQRGDRVALMAETGPEFMAFFYGCQYGGYVPVPLPVTVNLGSRNSYVERLRRLLQSCRATAAMAPAQTLPFLHAAAQGLDLRLAGSPRDFEALPEHEAALEPARPDEVAYLQYTSGSTRAPRGVVITQRAVMANLAGIVRTGLAVRSGDRCVSWLPFYHDMGLLLGVMGAVTLGRHSVLMTPIAFLQKPARWMQQLAMNSSAFTAGPNFAFELTARRTADDDLAGLDLGGVHTILSGSERIHAATIRRFTERFAHFNLPANALAPSYGLAEAMVYVCSAPRTNRPVAVRLDYEKLVAGVAEPAPVGADLVSIGAPRACTVRIVDPEARIECPDGQVGEIWVHGDNVAGGYWHNPEATERAFGGRLDEPTAGTPAAPWLRTGDLGVIHDGELLVVGRIKDLLIVDGRNHYPDDIEATVQEITGGRVAAIPVTTDGREQLVVVAELKARGSADEQARRMATLKRDVAAAVSRAHGVRVSDLMLVAPGSLPITTSGKIRRSTCADSYRSEQFQRLELVG